MSLEWVGDMDSDSAGRLGLWQICQKDDTSDNCQKQFSDMLSVPSVPFQVKGVWISFDFKRKLKNFSFIANYYRWPQYLLEYQL